MAASSGACAIEAALVASEDRRKVEAETVDAGVQNEMPERIEDQFLHHRLAAVDRIAGAGVVDQRAVLAMPVVGARIEAAQRQRRAEHVALAGVIEHQVEDHADAGLAQRRDRIPQFRQSARRKPRVERHEGHRIVAPGIRQPERRQVPFVDPRRHRHQFHRRDAEFLQMIDDCGMARAQRSSPSSASEPPDAAS